jgi:hypothetical protein
VLDGGNSGVITGVGVFDVVSGKYSDMYVLRNHASITSASNFPAANWAQLYGGSPSPAGGITLANITTSKVLVRPLESVFYSPGLYAAGDTPGAPYGTSGVLENRTVLAFAGYGANAVSGFKPFEGGGSFVATATFEWAATPKFSA